MSCLNDYKMFRGSDYIEHIQDKNRFSAKYPLIYLAYSFVSFSTILDKSQLAYLILWASNGTCLGESYEHSLDQ